MRNIDTRPRLSGRLVLSWFAQSLEGKKKDSPSIKACEEMAVRLREIDRCFETYIPNYPDLGKAGEYARLFLHHLPAARRKSENLRQKAEGFSPIQSEFDKVLDGMKKAEDAIGALLITCDWATKPNHSWHELAHHVRASAILAWRQSNIKPPTSVNPNDPMCAVVTFALAGLGRTHTQDAVSEALRGRRGKNKGKVS